ncbi:zinc-binding dehydrogenase [Xiashengella succiniciproducens]|uniref:zinc-binding dehydrogenase n=1 Tax=Xiashengella succiniciproducens TaxID=2949635 RepID=UPI003AF3239F
MQYRQYSGSQVAWQEWSKCILALFTSISGGKRVLFPIPTIDKNDLLFLRKLYEEGHYKPLIDRVCSLYNIVEAYQYVETRQKVGNVIISVT